MANPKRKFSKARTRKRRANWKISGVNISTCPKCKQTKRPHCVCGNCGFYRDTEILNLDEE